jgi:hypothetical protein
VDYNQSLHVHDQFPDYYMQWWESIAPLFLSSLVLFFHHLHAITLCAEAGRRDTIFVTPANVLMFQFPAKGATGTLLVSNFHPI